MSVTFIVARGQNPNLRNLFVEGFGDLGAIKVQAEQGDAGAQVKLADAYLSNFKSADALKWYQAAANQKSVEGEYQLGNLLLFGRVGIPQDQKVIAKPTEGLQQTYSAAINGHKGAWRNMAKARQKGIGCSTNLVEAYAWLTLLADAGDVVGRMEMNNLVLKLSSEEILRGKFLAREMKRGQWPRLSIQTIPNKKDYPTLKLNGVNLGGGKSLAIINGKTLAEGESATISLKDERISIKCLKINNDSVQVLIEGNNELRLLHLQ